MIRNTTKDDPRLHLIGALDDQRPGRRSGQFIEDMEAQGQRELCNGAQLPVDMRDDRAVFESWGIVFGEPHPDDPIFLSATLPKGWKVEPTDHAMWSVLKDAEGRTRARIFYKAAFYDRSAHMSACTRYGTRCVYSEDPGKGLQRVEVLDGEEVIHTEDEPDQHLKSHDREKAVAATRAWLGDSYPNHADPSAYWGDAP